MSSESDAFIQLIEFRTDRIDEFDAKVEAWAASIGANRAVRWSITGADRDRPGTYVQLVEFPSYEAAMANSADPATSAFADELRALCTGETVFRNLDVRSSISY